MKKIRTFFIRTILGIMAGVFFFAVVKATPAKATGDRYLKTIGMIDYKIK